MTSPNELTLWGSWTFISCWYFFKGSPGNLKNNYDHSLPVSGLQFLVLMFMVLTSRGGVLEDVLGFEDVLEDTFSSPWPRSLRSSKIVLSSARGQHYFLNHWNFFFHGCEVALTSHICFPIRLVFHQHLILHIAYPGIPPEPSNHARGQFLHLPSYPLLRLLWSKSDNKVTRKRILDQYHTGTSLSSTALR